MSPYGVAGLSPADPASDRLEIVRTSDPLEVVETPDRLEIVETPDRLEIVDAPDCLEILEASDRLKGLEEAAPAAEDAGTGAAKRAVLDGVAFHGLTEAGCAKHIVTQSEAGLGGCVMPINADVLRRLRKPHYLPMAHQARLVVADGMPLIWASRLCGTGLPERVAGASLIWSISELAAERGRRIQLLGGPPGVAERAAKVLERRHPALSPVGWHFPPYGFDKTPEGEQAVIRALSDYAPDIVFVGLGFPRQEKLMMRLAERFPKTWFIACGAGLTFMAGDVPRSPRWLQRIGFEWCYRLICEPRRLARRYLVDDLPYVIGLLCRSAFVRLRTAGDVRLGH